MTKEEIKNILERRKSTKQKIDEEIKNLMGELSKCDITSDRYKTILERVEKLSRLKKEERKIRDVDIGQLFQTVGNIAAILAILNYEKMDVVTSKSFGVFMKGVK